MLDATEVIKRWKQSVGLQDRPGRATTAASPELPDYAYEKLQGHDIRLITVIPGRHDDDIHVEITHVPLPTQEDVEVPRLTLEELRGTLPSGWNAFQTVGGRFLFKHKDTPESTWTHPSKNFNPALYIKSTGEHATFEPNYEAISYEWGSQNQQTETLYVDGSKTTKLHIRQNLASAIRHLRYSNKTRTLWTGAVCINQLDLAERGAQITRMADIYRLARRYLGSQRVVGFPERSSLPNPDAPGPAQGVKTLVNQLYHQYSDETWAAISNLLNRPWFERVWIVQEVLLAKDAAVVCGHDTIEWAKLWEAAAFLLLLVLQAAMTELPGRRLQLVVFLGFFFPPNVQYLQQFRIL
ncbi:heterokaryon incompatibility protein-domain-containing protein [Immersiella caudata]|uniref:Heterokaryon incompatibility protein-domain-containing protein n=1 Tax=Immersiella caudata TaxID=314043 RepID=A0AA39WEL1_9PEZI|nr:heterokaryon incompatibility protein-domain-containing protein [Immersiella caudata]